MHPIQNRQRRTASTAGTKTPRHRCGLGAELKPAGGTRSARIDNPAPRDSVASSWLRWAEVAAGAARWRRSAGPLALLGICLVALTHLAVLEANPIRDPADVSASPASDRPGPQERAKSTSPIESARAQLNKQTGASNSNETAREISAEALTDLIDRVTSALFAANSTEPATATTTASAIHDTETSTATTTTTSTEDDSPGSGDDDHDAEDCQGLSSGAAAAGARPTDNERLVNLQACLQKKVKKQLTSSARASMEMFERLSLSGACAGSLMNLMSSLGELKGFAFKFLDASAKIPSGMMSGLLSDFGDFEQCLAIRSNPTVGPEQEGDEPAGYSGKYCMLNIRMRYHIQLGPNGTAPDGIYPDGVLWDELVRHYWTSNSSKGFQVGVCVPSRCDQDDLEQMFKLFAESYHFHGEISACQDSNDVRRQQEPDALQWTILGVFLVLWALNCLGTLVDLYLLREWAPSGQAEATCSPLELLACFSIRRNWLVFLHAPHSTQSSAGARREASARAKESRPLVVGPGDESSSNGSGSTSSACNTLAGSRCSFHLSAPDGASCSNISGHPLRSAPYERLDELRQALFRPLTINTNLADDKTTDHLAAKTDAGPVRERPAGDPLSHLCGLKLLVIVWITVGHSFLYPSANNYQHYRSIVNMALTRTSVWFATTNFILGIDMLLYMTGLLFVCKLANGRPRDRPGHKLNSEDPNFLEGRAPMRERIGRLLLGKVLRLWPVYLSVIALAILAPLVSNGPMWPEVVTRRLGDTCRRNWWANLLMVNNFLDSGRVCLPSSWFISVAAQCFAVGSLVMMVANWRSVRAAAGLATLLIASSSLAVFHAAHSNGLNAPAIRMDESFVMELDDNIFKMYTSTLSNLGPFLVGMLGGFVLLWHQQTRAHRLRRDAPSKVELISDLMFELNLAFAMLLLTLVVLSSVFFVSYTPLWSAIYWSCHRLGWAIVTGYLVHQCATNKWRLLKQLLSLSSFVPLAKLIFLAYLVHPMFIHIHSGLVRDGLHVSLYNMLNIYISRLVMTFSLALALHLLVELPICSLERRLLGSWLERRSRLERRREWLEGGARCQQAAKQRALYAPTTGPRVAGGSRKAEPLLVVASDRPGPVRNSATSFKRQHTTETTLSSSSE